MGSAINIGSAWNDSSLLQPCIDLPEEIAVNEQEQNRRIAETICEQFSWNGHDFEEGTCVALLDGKIIAVAECPDDAIAALRKLDADPKRGMVVEVAHPVVDVIR
jgi:hypothetical protein